MKKVIYKWTDKWQMQLLIINVQLNKYPLIIVMKYPPTKKIVQNSNHLHNTKSSSLSLRRLNPFSLQKRVGRLFLLSKSIVIKVCSIWPLSWRMTIVTKVWQTLPQWGKIHWSTICDTVRHCTWFRALVCSLRQDRTSAGKEWTIQFIEKITLSLET